MVNDERAQKALVYLAETDTSCAEAKADMERAEYRAKAMERTIYLHETGSNDARNAAAKIAPEVRQAWEDYFTAVREYSAIANKRETERIVMDTWRTVQANRRQG